MKKLFHTLLLSACIAAVLTATSAQATPYATALTNTGSSISFRLNESADSVKIISDGGATTNDLGALAAGLHNPALSIAGPFQVEVRKGPSLGYLQGLANQISDDANRWVRFNAPRGVAVNQNPASPYFGRIYIANADNGSVSAVSRTLSEGDGIFMLNADFTDAVGQGDVARTGGLNFRTPSDDQANKPWRIEVGEDDNLYISDYTSAANDPLTANLYVADPNVSDGSGINVFTFDPNNAGRIPTSAIVEGSLGGGDLTVYAIYPDKLYDYDFFGFPATSFSVMQRWDVGAGPLPSDAAPVRVTDLPILVSDVPSVLSDIDIAPDGKYFLAQNRFDGLEGGLFVVDPAKDLDGSGHPDIVFDSYAYSTVYFGETNDLLRQTRAVKVAPDNSVVALVRNDNRVWIIPLTNGLPDLDRRMLMENPPATTLGRDIGFDAAGNLYVASSGQSALRVFSPGLASRATTGSDGTFNVVRLTNALPLVTLTSTDTNLYERLAGDTGNLVLTRAGANSEPLNVVLAYTGTAANGVDYETLSTTLTIPAGETLLTNIVVPVDNALLDGPRTLVASIQPDATYDVGGSESVTLLIRDDEMPPGPVLFSDDFDSDTSANYTVQFSAENGIDDKTVAFNYDYSLDGLPPAPHSDGGTTRGLKLAVNKNEGTANGAAGVNVYPDDLSLSNEFALRFDMYLRFGVASGTTEHAIFGINHSGTRVNRALSSGGLTGGDGVWFAVETDGSASSSGRSYAIFTSTDPGATPTFTSVSARQMDPFFTSPPFAGIPGGSPSGQWVDVEVIQTNNAVGESVITWKINSVLIMARTNTTPYTSGTIMLGHMDSFASIGSTDNYTIYDNVRVVSLTVSRPEITAIRHTGVSVEIDFTADPAEPASAFTLESATVLPGGFGPDAGASINALGDGRFRAVSPNAADVQRFYRIQR